MTARVQRQIAGLFVAEERGSHELKGVPEPVTLFQLVRAAADGAQGNAISRRVSSSLPVLATQSKSPSTVTRADQGQNMMSPASFFGRSWPLYSNPSWNLTSESWYSSFM